MIDIWDHEGNALAIYTEANADPSDPPGPHGLARMLGIRIRYDCRRLLGGAAYAVHEGEEFIYLRRGLSPLVEGMKIFHELAERHFKNARGAEDHEDACDQLAYRLRMPRPAFRDLVATVGRDFRRLSLPWPATETAGALRYLEVTDTPGVVVTPREVRARGPEWSWPPDEELRRIARARKLPDGVVRRRLTDRREAVVLLAS